MIIESIDIRSYYSGRMHRMGDFTKGEWVQIWSCGNQLRMSQDYWGNTDPTVGNWVAPVSFEANRDYTFKVTTTDTTMTVEVDGVTVSGGNFVTADNSILGFSKYGDEVGYTVRDFVLTDLEEPQKNLLKGKGFFSLPWGVTYADGVLTVPTAISETYWFFDNVNLRSGHTYVWSFTVNFEETPRSVIRIPARVAPDNFAFMHESKVLPMTSIVQPLIGSYSVAVENGRTEEVDAYGVFVVPRDKVQHISHHFDKKRHFFYAHWLFLDVVINRYYAFEDIFEIPTVIPEKYSAAICRLIDKIDDSQEYPFENYSYIYEILNLLVLVSKPKDPTLNLSVSIRDYISRHYHDKLTPEILAERFSLSMPTLYRFFSQNFGISPCNYINDYRLQRAALLLEHRDQSIKEVAAAVGFTDEYYFSKLFKKKYDISPSQYRAISQSHDDPSPVIFREIEPSLRSVLATDSAYFTRCIDPQDETIHDPGKKA